MTSQYDVVSTLTAIATSILLTVVTLFVAYSLFEYLPQAGVAQPTFLLLSESYLVTITAFLGVISFLYSREKREHAKEVESILQTESQLFAQIGDDVNMILGAEGGIDIPS